MCPPVSAPLLTHVEVYLFRGRPKRLLLLRRSAERRTLPGVWQPVTGSLRRGERAIQAAAREVREETGLFPRRWWTLEQAVFYFDPLLNRARLLPLFAAEVGMRDRVVLSDEHDRHRFVTLARAASLVLWDAQRAAIQSLESQLFARPSLAAALEITPNVARSTRRRKEVSHGQQ